jgi:hypothetical protein
MTEYTLVFRRAITNEGRGASRGRGPRWIVARPTGVDTVPAPLPAAARERGASDALARVFVVPICSVLGLDGIAYEHFLVECGVLPEACALLGRASLARSESVETARREIQALVMAAEVQHIVDRMSA